MSLKARLLRYSVVALATIIMVAVLRNYPETTNRIPTLTLAALAGGYVAVMDALADWLVVTLELE